MDDDIDAIGAYVTMKRFLALILSVIFISTICSAAEFRKWGVEDIEWGTGTWTSAGGVTSTKVPFFDSTDNTVMGITNVKSSGAVKGDGSTDDAAAIQAIIDAASSGDVLYFPKGILPP